MTLWYEHIGPFCVYCGCELVPLEKAFEKNDMNRKGYWKNFTKKQRRKADNHPTWDHVVPKAMGGNDSLKNKLVCCERCNVSKGSTIVDPASINRDIRLAWFETVDRHILSHNGKPYPDPY